METKTRFVVDAAYCQRAADELSAILREQERAFVTRWHSSKLTGAVVKTARVAGMLLSVLGLALCAALRYFDTDLTVMKNFRIPPVGRCGVPDRRSSV